MDLAAQALSFLQNNDEYLILFLLLSVAFTFIFQRIVEYLIIGRNYRVRPTGAHAGPSDSVIPFRKRGTNIPLRKKLAHRNNFERKNILNRSELRFFGVLCEALPDCHVFPQVSFNALVTHASWIKRPYWQQMVRSKFNAKYVDFVACNKLDLEVFAIVEYDGTGHNSKDDNERDRLLREAGYRVERFSTLDTRQSIRGRFGRSDRSSATVAFATPSSDKSPLYFVYGSNMNRDLMRQRYPDCKPVGIASLPDHRLAFPRHSQKQGCAIAGIEPEDGELVWGVLFDLGTGEKLHIDAGAIAETDLNDGSRSFTSRKIEVLTLDGKSRACFTFVAVRESNPGLPSAEYRDLIIAGAVENKLPEKYLQWLRELEVSKPPDIDAESA